jgi:hypothetical protein
MWRQLLRWLAPLLVAGTCWLPSAYAQQRYYPPAEPESGHNPAFPYAIAFGSTLLLLVIVCTPSRKK